MKKKSKKADTKKMQDTSKKGKRNIVFNMKQSWQNSDKVEEKEQKSKSGKKEKNNIIDDVKAYWKRGKLQKVLMIALLCVSLYVVVAPIVPAALYYLKDILGIEQSYSIWDAVTRQASYEDQIDEDRWEDKKYEGNWLVISKIGVESKIVEGQSEDSLNYGVWRRPNTSTPAQGGNTVITGHRFQYLPPNTSTFYNLDKLESGDAITIFWDEKRYDYEVTRSFVVEPTEVEVEDQTGEDILTLYTCTPLWTASQRLVVQAYPVNR